MFQSFGAGLAGFFGSGATKAPAAATGVLQNDGVNETILDIMWDQKVESEKVSYDLKQGNFAGINIAKEKSDLINVKITDLLIPTTTIREPATAAEPQPKNEQQEAPKNIDDV